MSKFTYFVLCVVALSVVKISALTEEEKKAFRDAITPIVEGCSKEHGISGADIQAVKEAGSADVIKACFLGCVFKKAEILDQQGLFDVQKGLGRVKDFVHDPDEQKRFEDIGKNCASVNDKPVSDGDSGCERSQLLLTCVLDHNVEIPL